MSLRARLLRPTQCVRVPRTSYIVIPHAQSSTFIACMFVFTEICSVRLARGAALRTLIAQHYEGSKHTLAHAA
jgi:hypothetical protein